MPTKINSGSIGKLVMATFGVAAGVILGGYLMSTFKDNEFIAKAREGFDTGFL